MNIQKLSAFTRHGQGGNPAGVLIADSLPNAAMMQSVAAELGYSETVFASPQGQSWRTRYFSPESEVPFCGHATIALGAALAREKGNGRFHLSLNNVEINVDGQYNDGAMVATLLSPPTQSRRLTQEEILDTLGLFKYERTAMAD